MTSLNSGKITELLYQIEQGNLAAHDELARLVRASLKRIAANRLRPERPDHLYQTSDLVWETYLMQMRRILVENTCRPAPNHKNSGIG